MGKGVAWRDLAHVTPKVKLCMHTMFLICCSRICWPKYHFFAFFGPDMNTEMGVVIYMYLKHFPNYIDSKYIWVYWCNSLGSSFFLLVYNFWHF